VSTFAIFVPVGWVLIKYVWSTCLSGRPVSMKWYGMNLKICCPQISIKMTVSTGFI
jgi:hypothetical protein